MKDTKTILNQLPKSWDEVSLGQFQKILNILITDNQDGLDGIDNSLQVISKLTDTPMEELEAMSLRDLQVLGSFLIFFRDLPKEGKASVTKWKSLDEITYNNYVSFIQIPADKQMENLHVFVKNFSKTQLTEEEILQLKVPDIMTGFFLHRRQLVKSLNHSVKSIRLTILKEKLNQMVKGLQRRIKK